MIFLTRSLNIIRVLSPRLLELQVILCQEGGKRFLGAVDDRRAQPKSEYACGKRSYVVARVEL